MKILVSALEPSANLHLGALLPHLEGVEMVGIFDEKFGKPMYPSDSFAIMGFLSIIGKYLEAKKAIKELAKVAGECDKVLLIDGPGFNIPLAKEIKKLYPNKEINYYILPKVWAWKEKRVKKVEAYTDRQISIFPFEDRYYTNPTYVGNPLLDEIPYFNDELKDSGKVAFLAGSRKGEIKHLMDTFRETREKIKDKEAILVIPPFFTDEQIESLYGDISGFTIMRDTYEAVRDCEFAFVCSGTATLEVSLMGIPMVLVWRAKKLDYLIANTFLKLRYVGLANIIFDFEDKENIHPEFLQDEVNSKNLYDSYKNIDRDKFLTQSKELRTLLKEGCSKRVAELLL